MFILALKLFTVPLLILLVSLAGQKFGPRLAGVLTGLPVIAGPIAWLLGLEHGVEFAARAAVGTL
ncbi:MAG TPA: hypothetical protein VFQ61_32870, partial [Polyangiaceae bacterium]|nr:hypothetical protein [Polyangiaceae bacterium]